MDRATPIALGFRGGFATDLPTQARSLDYWLKCENVSFEVDGSARKYGGATKINSSAITDSPNVMGMYDFWRGGAAASFTQKFVAVTSNGKVYKEDMDGTFDDITGAATIGTNAMPVFCQAGDLLLIFFSDNSTPLKWNMTGNVATLGGSPPAGRGAVHHANRVWTWGANANPSRITYGAYGNAEDYTGVDTGSLDLDDTDGDRIVGAVSHKEILFVFKGPNKGSIHMIFGTAPTGGQAFAKKTLVRGIALQCHNSIVHVADDVLFASDRAIHSLSAVQAFGNFTEKDVTRYLKTFFREHINRANMGTVWGVNDSAKSRVMWTFTQMASSENDLALGLSYVRLEEEGFKPFTVKRDCFSAAIRKHPTTKIDEVVFGGTDGFCRRQDTADRNIDSNTAYVFRMQSPELLLAATDQAGRPTGDQPFSLEDMYLRSVAKGDYDVMVTVRRDQGANEEYAFNQGAAGFVLGVSVLDEGSLGGGNEMQISHAEPPTFGQARAVQLDITQGGYNEDAHLLELGVNIIPTATSRASSLE